MVATRTSTSTRTVTVSRLALIGKQFSRFFQRFPDSVMDDDLRALFLEHVSRKNIDKVSLFGLDECGFAWVEARCTVNWAAYEEKTIIEPTIEVISGKEGLEVTVATLDSFDLIVSQYGLRVLCNVRLSPHDMSRTALMKELNLCDADPIQWHDEHVICDEDIPDILPELSVCLLTC